ncbi:hypothetical protein BREU_2173 [Bifidobacterium reuteri DSM 23975]|uniref:Uncharacterized protein n=1 Tax=Bifidobacterium reuteri DSM 23975 TaxID=1437610 RepID=A0A087CF57_9BIFI|nr:hypothetical protein BREU_2173 [Bifidobacterium reuteri DSM 23975]
MQAMTKPGTSLTAMLNACMLQGTYRSAPRCFICPGMLGFNSESVSTNMWNTPSMCARNSLLRNKSGPNFIFFIFTRYMNIRLYSNHHFYFIFGFFLLTMATYASLSTRRTIQPIII